MKVPKLVDILLFNESRKVGFGIWLKISSTALLYKHLITSDNWMMCVAVAGTLVGGGTLMDKYIESKKAGNVTPTPAA